MIGGKAFDFIVFGATGFTGKLISKYIHELNLGLKWAIAGRSQAKLASLMAELVQMRLPCNLPALLIADVEDPRGLADTFSEAKLVLNCSGPFRALGRDILEACVKSGSDYMDICSDPQFMEESFLEFNDKAIEKKILIIHACAFDSVPADLGCLFAARQFPPQLCASIESFLTIRSVPPKGTSGSARAAQQSAYEGAVYGIGDSSSTSSAMKSLQKQINTKYKPPAIEYIGPNLPKVSSYAFDQRVRKYIVPFKGADPTVVRSTHRSLALTRKELVWPRYNAYVTMENFSAVASTLSYGSIFSYLLWFDSGVVANKDGTATQTAGTGPSSSLSTAMELQQRHFELLLIAKGYSDGFPEIDNSESRKIGKNGEPVLKPSDVSPTASVFKPCSTFLGGGGGGSSSSSSSSGENKNDINSGGGSGAGQQQPPGTGVPDREVRILVSGPEPGCVASPAIFVSLLQCLLEERSILPKGGVLTPAAAFYDSLSVFARLERVGISFRIIPNTATTTAVTGAGGVGGSSGRHPSVLLEGDEEEEDGGSSAAAASSSRTNVSEKKRAAAPGGDGGGLTIAQATLTGGVESSQRRSGSSSSLLVPEDDDDDDGGGEFKTGDDGKNVGEKTVVETRDDGTEVDAVDAATTATVGNVSSKSNKRGWFS